jgi:Haemolysin secretion/activation protein ShlB/FhaC/HecB
MLVLVAASFALQVQIQVGPSRRRRNPIVTDSTVVDSTMSSRDRRRTGHRLPVTAEVLATAFKDAGAKSLLGRARISRLIQDSALVAYDATAYQRISVGMGFTKIGRDRVLFRNESVARVQWQQGVGAWIEVKGARTAIPMAPHDEERKEIKENITDSDFTPIPYYPGYEALWVGGGTARAQVDETEIVHPIADGAEAYYTFQSGDSLAFKLPDGKVIRLRELIVRPRVPKWNLAVGSLWFDMASAQLVRAAYRLSVPIDIWAVAQADDSASMDDVPAWVKPLISPMTAQVSAIAVEYGLHEGRFWLPRMRAAEASAQVSFMRLPVRIEQSFKYASVNVRDSLPPIIVAARRRVDLDTLSPGERRAWRDSVRARVAAEVASRDSACASGGTHVVAQGRRSEANLSVAVVVPCDISKLETSPELPGSIYDAGEEVFGAKERAALIAEALSLGAQPPIMFGHLPPPTIRWGADLMRYNRVEGFSAGAVVDQQIGGGYSAQATGRIGLADHEPNLDLTLTRSNLQKSIHVSGYNHLVSASDWGHPFSFGSSLSAFLFGRDEGFYFRASGVEIGGTHDALFGRGAHVEWRVFGESQRGATPHAGFVVNGADFAPNLVAAHGAFAGGVVRVNHSYGLDPRGLRVLSDFRLEAATGDSTFGRTALDVTASHGLGSLAGAITLSGGTSAGAVPAQRRWYLGGSQTVRGQSPDTAQSGDAFWFARAELGTNQFGARPTLFADLGWVGDRNRWRDVGRPMSGVGAGMSFVDGLFRFDVARGVYPRKQWRTDLYVEARF